MWRKIGKACGWKHPKAPSAKHLWKDEATGAVLEFLRDTRVGCLVIVRRLPREEEREGEENEEDGPGPPSAVFSFVSSFCFLSPLPVGLSPFPCSGGQGIEDKRALLEPVRLF